MKAGADVNGQSFAQKTPLMYAAQGGHRQIAELLLSAGATPDSRSRKGLTALNFAEKDDHADVVELLASIAH